ncbi:uncharacterized protein LOC143447053 [Clavelina lepadiformis]|uniref:Uncharacterized protein n=1 Tax=Clavelina lepadiformis TaxID=159417 RepID=A0ABP0GRX2_CLALP
MVLMVNQQQFYIFIFVWCRVVSITASSDCEKCLGKTIHARQRVCCEMKDILEKVENDVSKQPAADLSKSSPNEDQNDPPGLSLLSFGIGATICVIIGVLMLCLGCGVALYYCYNGEKQYSYTSPVITRRQSGRSTLVSVPIHSERGRSLLNITITHNEESTTRLEDQNPPKYEDISKTSLPVQKSLHGCSNDLPSYYDATKL